MDTAARGMSRSEQRRASAWALGFALAAYLFSWLMLHRPSGWLHAAGGLPQWPIAFDLLLTVPAVYWWLHRRERRRAWLGALALVGTGIWVATLLLPDTSGPLWSGLRFVRGLGIALVVLLEIGVMASMLRFVAVFARDGNPDYALREAVRRRLGTTLTARIMAFDMRMWLQVFAGARRRWTYAGDAHFRYDRKDGNAGNQQAFLILMLIDLPIGHALLLLFAGATAAWVLTVLTLLSLALVVAHYRATLRCPVSLSRDMLYLRYGLAVAEATVPLQAIAQVQANRDDVSRRTPGLLRLCDAGVPNVRIVLREPVTIAGWFGVERSVDTIALGIDQPREFLAELNARLAAREPAAPAPVHAAATATDD